MIQPDHDQKNRNYDPWTWTPTFTGVMRQCAVVRHDGNNAWTKKQAQAFFASDRCRKMEALGGRLHVMPVPDDEKRHGIFVVPLRNQGPATKAIQQLAQQPKL